MLSMESTQKRGYTFWDQSLLPIDEYWERVRTVKDAMRRNNLSAVLVFANNLNPGNVSYLAGNQAGTLLITPEGDPSMYTGGGGRELPFQRMLTWIPDVTTGAPRVMDKVASELKNRGVEKGTIGLVGGDLLSIANYDAYKSALSNFDLASFDTEMRDIRARKRPREVTVIRTALGMAAGSIEAGEKAFSEGASTTTAMIEAERSGRMNKGRDFRVLANIDGGEMRPLEQLSETAFSPLVMWVGLIYLNYWADLAVTFPEPQNSSSSKAVAAMAAAARAGAKASEVATAGLSKLNANEQQSALNYGLGNGIGLSLREWPRISPKSDDVLPEGALLTLRAMARDGDNVSFSNAIVQVGANGGTALEAL
jgi:Xaa-Pro aminopeptidase